MYGEHIDGKRNFGRPQLRYRDVCTRGVMELSIDKNIWEELVMDCSKWRSYLQAALKGGKINTFTAFDNKRQKNKTYQQTANHNQIEVGLLYFMQ